MVTIASGNAFHAAQDARTSPRRSIEHDFFRLTWTTRHRPHSIVARQ